MTGLLLLALAAALLVGGAELFVENAAGAARRLGLSVLAVGLLLAGAEPEELLTAVLASLQDRPDLAAGDAIGANVTILALALGLAAAVAPLPIGRRVRTYAAMSVVAGLVALLALADGSVSRLEGGGLVAAYVLLVGLVWWREREPPALGELAELEKDGTDASPSGWALPLALAGVVVMLAGGQAAVSGAVRVVEALGQTDSAVGLTVLALATSAEMFVLVLSAARHRVVEIAVAGVVGSVVYNATATLGAAALARPLEVTGMTWPALLAAGLPVVVVVAGLRSARLPRPLGLVLCVVYAAYVVLVVR